MDNNVTKLRTTEFGKAVFTVKSSFPGGHSLADLLEQIALRKMRHDNYSNFNNEITDDSEEEIRYNLSGR